MARLPVTRRPPQPSTSAQIDAKLVLDQVFSPANDPQEALQAFVDKQDQDAPSTITALARSSQSHASRWLSFIDELVLFAGDRLNAAKGGGSEAARWKDVISNIENASSELNFRTYDTLRKIRSGLDAIRMAVGLRNVNEVPLGNTSLPLTTTYVQSARALLSRLQPFYTPGDVPEKSKQKETRSRQTVNLVHYRRSIDIMNHMLKGQVWKGGNLEREVPQIVAQLQQEFQLSGPTLATGTSADYRRAAENPQPTIPNSLPSPPLPPPLKPNPPSSTPSLRKSQRNIVPPKRFSSPNTQSTIPSVRPTVLKSRQKSDRRDLQRKAGRRGSRGSQEDRSSVGPIGGEGETEYQVVQLQRDDGELLHDKVDGLELGLSPRPRIPRVASNHQTSVAAHFDLSVKDVTEQDGIDCSEGSEAGTSDDEMEEVEIPVLLTSASPYDPSTTFEVAVRSPSFPTALSATTLSTTSYSFFRHPPSPSHRSSIQTSTTVEPFKSLDQRSALISEFSSFPPQSATGTTSGVSSVPKSRPDLPSLSLSAALGYNDETQPRSDSPEPNPYRSPFPLPQSSLHHYFAQYQSPSYSDARSPSPLTNESHSTHHSPSLLSPSSISIKLGDTPGVMTVPSTTTECADTDPSSERTGATNRGEVRNAVWVDSVIVEEVSDDDETTVQKDWWSVSDSDDTSWNESSADDEKMRLEDGLISLPSNSQAHRDENDQWRQHFSSMSKLVRPPFQTINLAGLCFQMKGTESVGRRFDFDPALLQEFEDLANYPLEVVEMAMVMAIPLLGLKSF